MGDEDDLGEYDGDGDEDGGGDSGKGWLIPAECDALDFLARMGWTEEEVYLRQPVWWYERNWRIYRFQTMTGLAGPGSASGLGVF